MKTLIPAILVSMGVVGCGGEICDLVATDVSLDSLNRVTFTIENQGEGTVPENIGEVEYAVNGKVRGAYALGNLADQSWRSPGGSITITTPVRLGRETGAHGPKHRVSVFVDQKKEIPESNEFQNRRSRTVIPIFTHEPDLEVQNLRLEDDGGIRIRIQNLTTTASAPNLPLTIQVWINGVLDGQFTYLLPSLTFGTHSIYHTPSATIANATHVRVSFNTPSLLDERDNSNNTTEAYLPNGPDMTPYLLLIGNPKISLNLLWDGGTGPVSYNNWPLNLQNDLIQAVEERESGIIPTNYEPPSDGPFDPERLGHVAQISLPGLLIADVVERTV